MTSEEIVRRVAAEREWIAEGAHPDSAMKRIRPFVVEDWSFFKKLAFEDSDRFAVLIDADDPRFGDGLADLAEVGRIQARNPQLLVLRIIDRATGLRESVVMMRKDTAPTDQQLKAVGYLDPHAASRGELASRVQEALAEGSASTRRPGAARG
jgi:hypothetical protein